MPGFVFFDLLLFGQNGRWPNVLNQAAIFRLPAVQPVSGHLMVDSGEAQVGATVSGVGVLLQPLRSSNPI